MRLDELQNSTEPGQLTSPKRYLASSDPSRKTKRHCAQPGGLGLSPGSAALGFADDDGVGADGYDRSWMGEYGGYDKPLANLKCVDSGGSSPAGFSANTASGEKSPGKFVRQAKLIKIV